MENRAVYQWLAFACALPFVACAVALLPGIGPVAPFGALRLLAIPVVR